ncbi:hypothetical protein [Phenylobacterium sp.]|uniref:hypothetical protein n=1 Tax=Phenylobacterium sp. TaxID=1871053 RepID=UPI0030F3FD85
MRPSFLILAAALATAASAMAAEGRFVHPADTNKDDRLSRAEWLAYKLPAEAFDKADKNHDGLIDGPEFGAWYMAQQASK